MGDGQRQWTVRPLSKQQRPDYKDSFRIHLAPSILLLLKLRAGDLCRLELVQGKPKTAIAWTAPEKIQETVVQTSKVLQDCYGFKLGDKISITKEDEPLGEAVSVRLEECTDTTKNSSQGQLEENDREHWEWGLEHPLSRCEVISTGMVFDLDLKARRRSFRIAEISSRSRNDTNTIFHFTAYSKVRIGGSDEAPSKPPTLEVAPSGLGGLNPQVKQINETLRDFSYSSHNLTMPSFYQRSGGLLVYGPKGTGKSTLLSNIAAAGWTTVFTIGSSILRSNSGDGEAILRKNFADALRAQPSLVLIDQLDFIAPKRGSNDSSSVASVLCEMLDSVRNSHVFVAAATRHPNDVDDALRTPHRLGMEVELQVPTAKDRVEILRAIRGPSTEPNDALLSTTAEQTHGYVGADLFALLQLACRKARSRQLESIASQDSSQEPAVENADEATPSPNISLQINEEDVHLARQEVRPTAMREVFLETPKVRWTDIGGQHDIKRHLQKAVQRPLKFPERMKRLNVNSKRGILLYGPPGCSKTLMVKALATEAGLNFLAVKGAEILSMYVGESERALREIFRKARSASPSIIFFDEIDAIASKRYKGSQGGLNVLTTLLNEMDGIEELKNVLVVAATNKPDVIDPALMRPGRLDNVLYIGPPDLEARKEILNIWTQKSSVSEKVDLDQLASLTDGYSGAEIINICEVAADAALDEEEETGVEQEVRWRHFENALGQVRRQITSDVIQEYTQWANRSS
ncbi:AAA+-type ATPase [Arachnomyces sp. PD_36]|nr:AAA+-type ATPase [Arachnomyces sp. PD_36]